VSSVLREVVEADLPVFYEYEQDREAAAMAAFPPRDRDAFMARWAKTLADDSALTWTIVSDGGVAGNIGCQRPTGRFVPLDRARVLGRTATRPSPTRGHIDARPQRARGGSNVGRSVCSRARFVEIDAHRAASKLVLSRLTPAGHQDADRADVTARRLGEAPLVHHEHAVASVGIVEVLADQEHTDTALGGLDQMAVSRRR
jgi:hypothetical protein